MKKAVKQKILISVADESLAYIPVLEVELEAEDVAPLLEMVQKRADGEAVEGESEEPGTDAE